MAIKPILFNTEMVRAILDGRKDATRRIVKGFIPNDAVWGYTAFTPKGYISCRGTFADGYGEKFFKLPCEPGNILYVRETWKKAPNGYYYYEDWQKNVIADITKWKPSIRMPKEAARIWLKVTDVKVERLQNITEDGSKAETLCDEAKNKNIDDNMKKLFAQYNDDGAVDCDIHNATLSDVSYLIKNMTTEEI